MDPSVPFPHGAQLLPKPPPAAWIAKQLNPAPPPSKNQGGAAPKSPGSAKTWPPAIDAKASKAIEHARMKAEDSQTNQENLDLQALAAQMPEAADSRFREQSMACPKSQMTGKVAPRPPPKKPTQAPAKRSSSAPEKQQDPAAAKHQPELAADKAKSSLWPAQVQESVLQQTQEEEDEAPANAKPIASPDVPKHSAAASKRPTQGSASPSPCKAQLQSPPKAKAPVQSHQPSPPSSSTANPASSSAARAGSNESNQQTIPRSTGWKDQLALFTRYWFARDWETTTSAIDQLTADLERTDPGLAATTPKGGNPRNRTWQGNAYSLVSHYRRENWNAINDMIYQWCRDNHFANLVGTTTFAHARDRRMPDWWGH